MTLKKLFEKVLHVNHIQLEEETASYFVEREGDTLRLLFEKSNGRTDWMNNLDFPAKPYRDMEDQWHAHRGFLRVWKAMEPHLADLIADPTVKRIEIAGYSHGGAVALLCFEYCKYHRPEIEVVGFGFGAPRVVWGPVPEKVKARLEGFVVIRNGADLVTHLPPLFFGYRHTGPVCHVYKHGMGVTPIKDHYPDKYRACLSCLDVDGSKSK